jgi:3D (Asp-Asp-Asp) domain-containing protein
MSSRTRNERRRNRTRFYLALAVILWAVAIGLVMCVPAKSNEATEAVEPILEDIVNPLPQVVNYDMPASGYANLELLECLGTFKVTAYCCCPDCCGIWSAQHPSRVGTGYVQKTASGTIPQAGRTVAADWSVLPSGTEILVNGELYVVEDTGSAVVGRHIDIYMEDHSAAREWGVQHIDLYKEVESD